MDRSQLAGIGLGAALAWFLAPGAAKAWSMVIGGALGYTVGAPLLAKIMSGGQPSSAPVGVYAARGGAMSPPILALPGERPTQGLPDGGFMTELVDQDFGAVAASGAA